MFVRRKWHGFESDFIVERRRIDREMNRQAFLLGQAKLRPIYLEPNLEHYVCPEHDNGLDSKPCATIQIMGSARSAR